MKDRPEELESELEDVVKQLMDGEISALPTKVRGALYVVYSHEYNWLSYSTSALNKEYSVLAKVEFDVHFTAEVTKGMLLNDHIDWLKAEQEQIRAEANAKIQNIDESIQRMLAIEHKAKE